MSKIFKGIKVISTGHQPLVMDDFAGYSRHGGLGGEIGKIERVAYEKGFAAGEKAGFEFGRSKADALFNGLATLLDDIALFRERFFKQCEKEIVDLTFAIANKVILCEVESNKEIVIDGIRNALKLVMASSDITIRVNPKDLEVINQYRDEFSRYVSGVKGLVVEGDDSIARGGSVIETNYGEVDSTISGILAEIEERLKSAD